MFSVVSSVVQVGVTAAGAWSLGHLLAGSRWRFPQPALQIAAETAIGLLIISHLVFASVLLGWATPLFLYSVFLALALLVLASLRHVEWSDLGKSLAKLKPKGAISWAVSAGCTALGVWIMLLAVLPPIGFDSLVYHLEIPRQMLEAGGKVFFPDNFFGYYPQLTEMLFLYGLGIAGETAAKLFHSLFGVLLALAIFGLSREHVSQRLAFLATALFLTVPSVVQVFALAYVDLSFSLYVFLALAAVLQYFDKRQFAWVFVAGIMVGGAWATKYTGMQVAFLFSLILLIEHLVARRKEIPAAAVVLPAVAFSVFLPYLLRTWMVTGWPFFPFQFGDFALHPGINWDAERSGFLMDFLYFYGVSDDSRELIDRLVAPLLVFVNARFWKFEAYDGMIGPVFLLTPVLLLRRSKPRDVKFVILFSILYMYYWTTTTLQVRFLLPVLPALAFLLVYGLSQWRSKILYGGVIALMLVSLGLGVRENLSSLAWNAPVRPWLFWTGRESREEFWERQIIVYPIYQEANKRLGPQDVVYLVDMRHFGYLLECRWRADFIFQRWNLVRLIDSSDTAADLAEALLEQGLTHLMIDEVLTLDREALTPRQRGLFVEFLNTRTELVVRNPIARFQSLWRIAGPRPDASAAVHAEGSGAVHLRGGDTEVSSGAIHMRGGKAGEAGE